ncbi:AraC family transcriptional regulator [Streptosporangiaceae bacterium NEAU-GS5]|nr:AraC family transcriptional regulator [Streptosporangiaceae bacterium NEAU-GS5]
MTSEAAHFFRHPGFPDVDLLRARFVTHRYARHAHEGYAIGVIVAGVEEFDYRGGLHRAGAGEIVLVNPESDHTGHAGTPHGWAYRMLYPPLETLADLAGPRPYFPEPVVSDVGAARLLVAAHVAAERGDPLTTSTLLRTAFSTLLARHASVAPPREPDAGSRSVRLARDILHARMTDPPTLEDLAAAVGARPFPLLRAFKAELGLPPHAYLTTVRVRRARDLLQLGLPPAQVAAEVGFTDQAHLTRHFKRVMGVPPGAYRAAGTYKTA